LFSLPASFTAPSAQLAHAASTLLDTFRALIPLTSTQIADVPTLSMQLVNDFSYIASRLPSLNQSEPSSHGSTTNIARRQNYDWGMADQQRRLSAFAESSYESQLRRQVDGLMELLDEAQGWDGTGLAAGSRRCEGAIRGVKERIDSLGRVLKVCPKSFSLMIFDSSSRPASKHHSTTQCTLHLMLWTGSLPCSLR
jgi:hypothetical protein